MVYIGGKPISKKLVDILQEASEVDLNEEFDALVPSALARQTAPGDHTPRERVSAVPVPEDYDEDIDWHGIGDNLHDYCSYSPNQNMPVTYNDAPIADFMGPCAIHDQCMDPDHNGRPSNVYCHLQFRSNLEATCDKAYAGEYPTQHKECLARKDLYYSVVLSRNP